LENAVNSIDETDAQAPFDALLDRVEQGEAFVITRSGKPIAQLSLILDQAAVPPRNDEIY